MRTKNGPVGCRCGPNYSRGSADAAPSTGTYSGLVTEMHEAQAQETQDAAVEPTAPEAGNDATPRPGRPALWVLGVAALLSLGGVLYSLYRNTGMADGLDDTGVMILALSLFSPIIVSVFAGAVAALIAPRLVKGPQKAVAFLGALVAGLVAGGTGYAAYSVDASIALILGVVLLGSGLVGGLIGLSRHAIVLAAGFSATLLLLLVMYTRGIVEASSSLSLFSDPLDEYNALGTAIPFIAGLACGLCAFVYLRKRKAGVKLLGHLLAGAIPGGVWLISTIIAQIGVTTLLGVGLDEVSPLDEAFLAMSFQWQYNGSMTAMFAGAFCAVLAYGLLMPSKSKAAKAN